MDATAAALLGSASDPRVPRLKQSIQYYLDGTKDGFLKYRPATTGNIFKDIYYLYSVLYRSVYIFCILSKYKILMYLSYTTMWLYSLLSFLPINYQFFLLLIFYIVYNCLQSESINIKSHYIVADAKNMYRFVQWINRASVIWTSWVLWVVRIFENSDYQTCLSYSKTPL